MCPPQPEGICSLRCGTGFLVCIPALGLASQDLPMPFCPPIHSTAPSSVPEVTPEMGMERGKPYCCLHRDVTPSTKLSHFSSESHCATAGCA